MVIEMLVSKVTSKQSDCISKTLKTIAPSIEDAKEYHSNMAASNLARATVNIRRAALIAFYKSQGLELGLPYLKPKKDMTIELKAKDIMQFEEKLNQAYAEGNQARAEVTKFEMALKVKDQHISFLESTVLSVIGEDHASTATI